MSTQDHPRGDESSGGSFLASPAGLVLIGFLVIGGAYLWMEHRAHLFGALIWLPLLACLLMHLFMHHGHSGHSGQTGSASDGASK